MLYRYYKGGFYEHFCAATQESDLMPMIVYRAADGGCWIKPSAAFFKNVMVDGKPVSRFAPID